MRPFPRGIDYKAARTRRKPIIYDMAVFEDRLIVTGVFNRVANLEARFIASWNGSNWSPMGAGLNLVA